jgi:hypothetical protein
MEIVRMDFPRSVKTISRGDFCEQLRRILAEQFPDETVEKLSIAADLEHTLSRVYARGTARRGTCRCAFLAVPEGETPDAVESSLTFALLWLDRARQAGSQGNISFLRLILPKGHGPVPAHRLAAVDTRLAIQVYELDGLSEKIERVNPTCDGNVSSWLVPRRETQMLIDRADAVLSPVLALAPEAIRVHASPQNQEVTLRFRGLPFARWQDGRIYFGLDARWEELRGGNENKLKQLILRLQNFRNPLASNMQHPLFRAQAERWLQAMVMDDAGALDINLDPGHVYEQVFAQAGGKRGILDLLVTTRTRRLAILELKATENPDLPLQAAEYWARIRRHQVRETWRDMDIFQD